MGTSYLNNGIGDMFNPVLNRFNPDVNICNKNGTEKPHVDIRPIQMVPDDWGDGRMQIYVSEPGNEAIFEKLKLVQCTEEEKESVRRVRGEFENRFYDMDGGLDCIKITDKFNLIPNYKPTKSFLLNLKLQTLIPKIKYQSYPFSRSNHIKIINWHGEPRLEIK